MFIFSDTYTGNELALSWVEHLNPINFVDDDLEVTEYRIKNVQAVIDKLIYMQDSKSYFAKYSYNT